MKTREFSFSLPEELIAQEPPKNRGDSRLLALNRLTGAIQHDFVSSLAKRLPSNSVLVLNDSKVRHARIFAHSTSGGRIEMLMVERIDSKSWKVMMSKKKKQRVGKALTLDGGRHAVITGIDEPYRIIECHTEVDDSYLETYGHIPLPPYIKRADRQSDAVRYQTVYARELGSAAAPTAGLHITEKILDELRSRHVQIAYLTLHVGLGTFLPVRSEDIENHTMHEEHYSVPEETSRLVTDAKRDGRAVFAVGTTSVRTLESAWGGTELRAGDGATRMFIYPGYEFGVVDGLLTNFHTPESSLLMLVSAFAGTAAVKQAYLAAIEHRYRFFSYGDAMLIS